MKTFTVSLGGVTYTLHPFTFGQLEQVSELYETTKPRMIPSALMRMAFQRSDPPVENIDQMQWPLREVLMAQDTIMRESGMKEDAAPGEAGPATAA